MTVLQVCAYGAEYAGNFIASLETLEKTLAAKNIKTIYAFIDRAESRDWCKKIQQRTKVYFLPEAKARILPETYRIFRRIYSENDISIVHSHFELYDIPATVMAPKQIRVFWHLHDAIGEGYQKSSLSRRILTHLQYGVVGKRAKLLTVSLKHGAFAESIGFPKEQIQFVPNGIDTRRIRPVTVKPDSDKFVMLGWDILRKGVDIAIDAARIIRHKDISLVVVGYEECKMYLAENNAPECIHFQEPVSDVNLLYQDTRAFLHISRAEGLSYALLEVIYVGLPVVCSDIPENHFASEFKNVYFVKCESDTELADAIDSIVEGAYIPAKTDLAYNRKLIEDKYSLDAWCKTIMDIYLR